jgi:hypothetical protein
MLARAETVAVEKHRDDDDAAPCSARIEVRTTSAETPGVCRRGLGSVRFGGLRLREMLGKQP